jgi:hypothetical protein
MVLVIVTTPISRFRSIYYSLTKTWSQVRFGSFWLLPLSTLWSKFGHSLDLGPLWPLSKLQSKWNCQLDLHFLGCDPYPDCNWNSITRYTWILLVSTPTQIVMIEIRLQFKFGVATLVLGSRPRQRGCKGAGQEEARESHHILMGV